METQRNLLALKPDQIVDVLVKSGFRDINDDGVDIEFKTSEIKSVKEVYSEQESA